MISRYRSSETLAMGWALLGLSVVILLAIFKQGFSALAVLVAMMIALLAWLVAIRPAIKVYEHVLVIQNVFRKHEIPWPVVTDISTTLLLTVTTADGRRISSWAISSSRRSKMRGDLSRAERVAFELEQYRSNYRA
ncbi:hypothetical protein GALL_373970 [mine drainage metagenome]|uniref:PH domain-containing protein n=1 Tax=mine drainage metagenome TaxID=410659 RepID=A0A1J5QBQ3_9ZZZZ